jgi:cytochrome c peroxidase
LGFTIFIKSPHSLQIALIDWQHLKKERQLMHRNSVLIGYLVIGLAGSFAVQGWAQSPSLPDEPYEYADIDLPFHFLNPNAPGGSVVSADNEPGNNQISNEGATLGRVLFYDKRLSANDTVSCGSCHQQAHGFSDPDVLSTGFEGGHTGRHSMGLSNAKRPVLLG